MSRTKAAEVSIQAVSPPSTLGAAAGAGEAGGAPVIVCGNARPAPAIKNIRQKKHNPGVLFM
jgi:hypothetical protein